MTEPDTSPKYNVAIVEAVILEVAAELHPENLTAKELSLRVISDADDAGGRDSGSGDPGSSGDSSSTTEGALDLDDIVEAGQ